MRLSLKIKEEGWTEENLKSWAAERAWGIQYVTPYGPVRCPPRWWEAKKA